METQAAAFKSHCTLLSHCLRNSHNHIWRKQCQRTKSQTCAQGFFLMSKDIDLLKTLHGQGQQNSIQAHLLFLYIEM